MNSKNETLISNNAEITVQTLNKSLSKLFSNNIDTSASNTVGVYATTSVNGLISFTDSITLSADTKAINPYLLHHNANSKCLDSFYNNDAISSVLIDIYSMKYIILSNNIIMLFGKIDATKKTDAIISIPLNTLFASTPYILQSLYFVSIGGEITHTYSPASVLQSINTTSISLVNTHHYKIPLDANKDIREIKWFALGKIG